MSKNKTNNMSETIKKSTACILCSLNCGITVELDEKGDFKKIIGDKGHPYSKGYMCQKATRLGFYAAQPRPESPLKRMPDGSYEPISWDQAFKEIGEKLVHIRDTYGGTSIAYCGGGGQANHLGGAYASTFRAACRTPYIYTSLAQEKTGNFWVHGKLFGRQTLNACEPVGEGEYVLIIGANPLQAHGVPQARPTVNGIARDKKKTMVVVDIRKTETAKKADIFLQVKPGKDAYLMAAIIGVLVQENLVDRAFLEERTVGYEAIAPHFEEVPVAKFAKIAGVEVADIQKVARGMAAAESVVVRTDLGLEQSHNTTLNAYLSRLLYLVTGNFGKEDTNCLHTFLIPVVGHSKEPEEGGVLSKVTKMKGIGKMWPPNIFPLEVNTDHPDRIRAAVFDSTNPVINWANTKAQIEAVQKLELSVVIDVAFSETAQEAQYYLPAANQFEKMEGSLFNLEFPSNFFHLRHPVKEKPAHLYAEPDIYHRIVAAMGEIPLEFPKLAQAAQMDRMNPSMKLFPMALELVLEARPEWRKYSLLIIKETLGKALPYKYAKMAGLIWGSAHAYARKYPKQINRAGIEGKGYMLGEALFNKILNSKSGTIISTHTHEEMWDMIRHPDKKVHLYIPEGIEWLNELEEKAEAEAKMVQQYPFSLICGERRSYNANTIIRNPEWRKKDPDGVMKINPADAAALGIQNHDEVNVTSKVGSIKVVAEINVDTPEKIVSLPHGYGLKYKDEEGKVHVKGPRINYLTALEDCDPFTKTPFHKSVAVKLEKVMVEA